MSEDFSQSIVARENGMNFKEEVIPVGFNFPPQKSKKLKIIFTILGLFFIVVSILAGIYLVKQRQEIGKKAANCSDSCQAGSFCYNECVPGQSGYSRSVSCSSEGQWIVGSPQQDPACVQPLPSQSPSSERCTPPGGKIGNDGPGGCCGTFISTSGEDCDSGACRDWEECRISNSACASGTSCGAKECKPNGASCSGNWECCSGGCIGGICQGGQSSPSFRSALQVCQEFGGTETSQCIADPNCRANGGICCNKGGTNYCCYGDSSTRRDGACYAGGLQTDVTCSGSTITNNTNQSFTVLRFVGDSGHTRCPFHNPAGTKTLAPGASLTANCEQLEVPEKCGVCDDSTCDQPSPSTTPSEASCHTLRAYNTSWQQLSSSDLASLRPGNQVYFAVLGSGSGIDKARFRINGGNWQETTNKKIGTEEFYISYTIPKGVINFTVQAEVHYPTLGWK